VLLQPSPEVWLPSSQPSGDTLIPLPHCSHSEPGAEQLKPASTVWQSAEQPSPP
jgi:hypothetical protein